METDPWLLWWYLSIFNPGSSNTLVRSAQYVTDTHEFLTLVRYQRFPFHTRDTVTLVFIEIAKIIVHVMIMIRVVCHNVKSTLCLVWSS